MQKMGLKTLIKPRHLMAVTLLSAASVANAGTLNGGVFNFSFDNPDDLLAGLTLGSGSLTSYYVANYFDKTLADTMDANQMLAVVTDTYPGPATMVFDVNPSSLVGSGIPYGSGGRNNQATTLTWNASQDALTNASSFSATGQVGLNGVIETRGSFTGTLLSGDYKFSYIASRNNGINSGWTLTNNVSFASNTFDTRNISISTNGDELTFSGELWWSPSTTAFLFGGDSSYSAGRAGTFSLVSPAPVPVPAAVWLFASGLGGLLVSAIRRKALLNA